ncbi:FtsK/SpoIIIE domain-containing protein [Cellulomonas cellasea]|uniref:FtsK/SpoIIIE domain-containing protein n=1 Tax=Cellulomonas cellasea TaxID=43670 RepID=UPI0025A4242C|nr:FtsK/SpoIIIE domain-containing protein [Cellulomonas cellasea]MDM8084657.1 FtsK/SpoIIIE domain-containing protein [Cellulomonas cellasea]
MRLTLHSPDPAGQGGWHVLDVEADEGTRLGELRPHLARLTGHAGWAGSQRLAAGAEPLDDAHPCGSPPLVAGAVLRLGRGRLPEDEAALRSAHLAVLSGPDCGRLLTVAHATIVGRRGSDDHSGAESWPGLIADSARRHVLADPMLSARHLELRPHRRGAAVRDLGSANGTTLHRARGRWRGRLPARGRSLSGRWMRLRPGDRIRAGASELELRSPAGEGPDALDAARDDVEEHASGFSGGIAWTWMAPTVGSVALAATTGHRMLLLCALIGPLVAVGQVIAGRRRRARAAQATARGGARDASLGNARGHERPAPPIDNPADLVTATLRAAHTGATRFAVDACGPDRVIALVGSRQWTLGATRALLLGAVGSDGAGRLTVRADADHLDDWSWARWIAEPAPTSAADLTDVPALRPHVTVVDGPDSIAAAARHPPRHPPGAEAEHLVLLAPTASAAPAWCRTVLHVRAEGAKLSTPLGDRPAPLHLVSAQWAERQARRIAGLRGTAAPAPGAGPALPNDVALGDLPGVPEPDAEQITQAWAGGRHSGLHAMLGRDASGPVSVDLVRDGPHALVAGTTGAGKSALLRTLVLSLALAHPPERLAIALVDYKGGASFGPCADLPHVVGQVTDLDGHLALRALTGLRAELRRREHALAEAGCADVSAWWARHVPGAGPTPPPRLLVVIDEFRALADEAPDFVPGLLRLAAQGRSLGMHLVLATQRPAGAVNADLRANIALRIALRVTDAAESLDVLDAPDAALLPANRPGRAVLRRGNGPVEHLHVAQARARTTGAAEPVRLAAPWSAFAAPSSAVPSRAVPSDSDTAHSEPDEARRFVEAVRSAAQGRTLPTAPWLPELPRTVRRTDLPPDRSPVPDTVTLALADVPDQQRRELVRWSPRQGHLLVVGPPGSGRTTALSTAAAGALELGWHVHAVGFTTPPLPIAELGTVVGADDPRRLARLLALLADRPRIGDNPRDLPDAPVRAGGAHQLVLVDGWEATLEALDAVGRGAGGRLLLDLLRDGLTRGVTVAASSGATGRVAALSGQFHDRLVLGMDAVDQVLAGVPTELTGLPRMPGRAVHLRGSDARECQVALPDGRAAPRPLDGSRVLRLRTIPDEVAISDLMDDEAGGAGHGQALIPIGLGGDEARAVGLDVSRGALVVGPAGSGRTTALAVLATGLLGAGRPVAVVGSDPALLGLEGPRWASAPEGLTALLDELAGAHREGLEEVDLLVDDLDSLDQMHPVEAERLAQAAAARPGGLRLRLIASARTGRAATAYREPIARLRSIRAGLVLDPLEPGSADVFGVDLTTVVDPSRAHAPGRGALVRGRELTPVQVARLVPR